MFMSVDLPAPFSPSNAWISPRRRSRSIASFARVPVGNRFVIPRISRTDGWSLMRSSRDERADPSAGPLDLDSFATCALGDRLELPGCHVRGRLLELVLEPRRNGVEVADHGCADAAVRGVVDEVSGLLALVFEALDPVPYRDLQMLFGTRDDAGLGIGKGEVLIDVYADAIDLRAARGAKRAGA